MPELATSYNLLKIFIAALLLFNFQISYSQDSREFQIRTIAFYNIENLFDTENDPFTFDDDRTPTGADIWTQEKYSDKLSKIAKVLSQIGTDKAQLTPAIIGLCELENLQVLEDLIEQPQLKSSNYGIVHYDSPDRRGVDVALLYRQDVFVPLNSQSRRLMIFEADNPTNRVYTRDQLVVSGLMDGELMHFIVNHWPSRSGGEAKSSYRRELAAGLNNKIIDSLRRIDNNAKIITMGDFNDDPTNKSIKKILRTKPKKETTEEDELFNPMEGMLKKGMGTLAFRDGWNLFDQILMSQPLVKGNYTDYKFYKAGIYNPEYLITPSGQFRGYPFRSYDYGGYTGGYSDHFPVYVYLIREISADRSP